MSRFDAPFPKSRINGMFSEWASFMKRRECASILSLPRFDRQYRIPHFMQWYQEQSDIQSKCISFSFQSLVSEVWPEIKKKLDYLRRDSPHTTFLISDPEWLLNVPHVIPYLEQYVLEPYRSVSFLFFFEKNIYESINLQALKTHSIFFQNVWYQTLYDKEDMSHYFNHLQILYKQSVTDPAKNDIWDSSGGYIWLTTEAFRYVSEHNEVSYTHDAMLFRLRAIWEQLSGVEQMTLKNIVRKVSMTVDSVEAIKYFHKTGLITEKMEITVPIFTQYICSLVQNETTLTQNKQGKIFIGQVCIDASLSPVERKLMHFFLSHPKEIVSREMTANAVWGNHEEDSYSDWNLDQSINRLRKRLRESGLVDDIIQTKKGKGYYVAL